MKRGKRRVVAGQIHNFKLSCRHTTSTNIPNPLGLLGSPRRKRISTKVDGVPRVIPILTKY